MQMETPNLNTKLRGKPKKQPVDQELRELRGFAVEIKSPMKPGELVRNIQGIIIDDNDSSQTLPSISGGGLQQTFGATTNYQKYGNQSLMAVDPYDKQIQGMPYGALQQMKDQYDHTGSYRGGQTHKIAPRFTQINRTVGEFISLQYRLNQDQTNLLYQNQQNVLTPEQQLKYLKEQYLMQQQKQNYDHIGQRDINSIGDPYETINETQTNSVTEEWQSTGPHGQKFVTVPAELRTSTRNGKTSRSVGRIIKSSQQNSSQLPNPNGTAQARRVSQEVSQRSTRGDGLGKPKYLASPNEEIMLKQNPNTKVFKNFMSKVIASVKTRTNRLDQSDIDQSHLLMRNDSQQESQQAAAEFTQTRHNPVGSSMLLSGHSSVLMGTDLNMKQSQTPANIRASARREIGMSADGSSGDQIAKTKASSQSGFHIGGGFAQQPRAAEQVAYLLKQVQRNKDKVFIPLEAYTASTKATTKEATILKDSKHQDRVEPGNYVFSQQGFVKLGSKDNPTTDFISKEAYIQDGVDFMIIGKVPFFRKFLATKTLKRWRYTVRARIYERNRNKLAANFIFARPMLAERFKPIVERSNQARFLKFVEIKEGVVYGKMQQFNMEQRCEQCCRESKTALFNLLADIKKILSTLKDDIEMDDASYKKAIKLAEVEKMLSRKSTQQGVVMFSKERAEFQHIQGQLSLSIDRRGLFNKLVQFIQRFLTANLIEMLYEEKKKFKRVFCSRISGTQFEVSLCFDKTGFLNSDPSISEHISNFHNIFQQTEDSIFKNSTLSFFLQDLPELFFNDKRIQVSTMAQINMRRVVSEMEKSMKENHEYQAFGKAIFSQLELDIKQLKEQLEIYADVQKVYDFTQEWNKSQTTRQLSLNMGFYNETFEKIQTFNQIIALIPNSNTRLGTILLETITIKKQLAEMPVQIMNSIRHNVTQTMDNETRLLKEDLSKTSEILEQTPTSLNVYVEQVNTLKFVKQKQKDFDTKYDIIHRLKKQCLEDNIKVSPSIEMSIHHVQALYKGLPALCIKAQEGLQKNKESMEKIMNGSSKALSKKIKSFEKKYVENYLQDQSRLEDCSVTLEELFKRSTAIHEIKSKVMLYKEFLKLLYENDPEAEEKLSKNQLSCSEDCDFLQDVHKHTIRLWQNLLFWKKRKRMCYETPFLQLDLDMIQRSITKIITYFEKRLIANEFVHKKCQPLTRQIEKQVKETSVIVDFAKELHKESLQRRHWVQFFTLIKASHLKNSTTFTIIDLSEYKIQNYSEDIKLIINHAFTESRYENVFKSIKSEWEKADLRILPFKDSLKDYVIANTDILSDSIEESLGTLETLHNSDYAAHVRKEIQDLIIVLKKMLEHLDKWIQAQKYWVTLDPIYNSGLFGDIFGSNQRDFLETRAQFRRIMWSSYRNPAAMYNLLIKERTKVFISLIEYYLILQQKTHEYLEEKRLSFTRFYFLNDSQFLDFLMLANSNQDYSVYINILFQGAQNLFISQIKPSEHVKMLARVDTLGIQAQIEDDLSESVSSEEESDVEAQLEAFMSQGFTGEPSIKIRGSQESGPDIARIAEVSKVVQMPQINVFKEQNEFDPVFKVEKNNVVRKRRTNLNSTVQSPEKAADSSEIESLSIDSTIQAIDEKPAINSQDSLSRSERSDDEHEQADQLIKLQNQYVLGLLSMNRELFLFDRQVKIGKRIESWLTNVEDAMRISVKKHMKNAILRFANQPLEEWLGDYPQQVAISVIHLVISQEISDTLGNNDFEGPDGEANLQMGLFHEEKVTIGKPDPNIAKALATVGSEVSAKSKEKSVNGEQTSQQEKTAGQGNTNILRIKDNSELDDYKSKILAGTVSNRPALEIGEQHANFLDDAFGENTDVAFYLDEATLLMRREENRMSQKNKLLTKGQITKKPDYKEQVLNCLQYKGIHSLWLRIAFWINKCILLLHRPKQESYDKPVMNFELLGLHKMQIKSVIMFLKYQQEMVDRLIKMKVTDGNDFEWQSKLRTSWSLEDEGVVQCGGWSMNMGYEYLGTNNRLSISPLTERYFVFMASSLREKSSVVFQCIPEHQMAASIVEEMASLCSVPFKTITCSEHSNLSSLTQLLNGVCMSQVWLFLEFMDKLPLIGLSILLKEIQLIHQQFVTNQFSNAVEKERKRIEGVVEEEELEQILRRRPTINIGIFGSIQHMLPIQKPTISEEFVKQIRTSFRVIKLSKPDMNYLFKSYLFMENFTLPQDTTHLLMKFFEHFQKVKHRELYEGKLESEITEGRHEELSLRNLRTALKLSKLLKDQEWSAFSQKQIEKDTFEFRVVSTIDKFEVVSYLDNIGRYVVKQKDRQMYLDERARQNAKKQFQNETKFQIELDSLKEGFRVVVKTKVLTEWRKARFALYEKKKAAMFLVEEEMIDTSHIEAEIDQAILEAFESSVKDLKKQGELTRNTRDIGKVGARHVAQSAAPVHDEDDSKDASSLTIRAQHSRETRLLQRKNSIVNYKFSSSNLTPFLRKNTLAGKRSSMKHSTTVDLIHNVEREAREQQFREKLEYEIKLVAQELQIAINDQQVYNCVGIVETMRRNKGIVISGPQCSGKTQIVKIITIALKRAFNVTIRSTFITPETFSDSELYGPTQAFQNSQELSTDQNSLRKSVFEIILNSYAREKSDMKPSEANRLIQSIYLDSAEINSDLADAVSAFLSATNTRERDYQKDTEFILSFSRDNRKIQSVQVQHTPMRFPNGNVIMMPSELYFFFETISLDKISPVFLANVGIVNTQHTDVTPENLFFRHLQLLEKKHQKFFTEFDVFPSHFKECADKFVINFIMRLNQQPMIKQWSLWNLKSLTLQFFNILNAFLYRLEDNCRLNLRNEDPMDYPFVEMQKDILWNCMLVAATWSFGAVLDKELRRTFEEQFGSYRNFFNITFSMPMKQKFTLFEIFFDVERLTWAIISDKLDYKIKVHFNQDLNTCVLPTNEISQAYFVSDYLIYALGKEKDLNKNIRLVGPQSSSKTVFLNTFEKKLPTPMTTISIPMTAYLTMDRLKQKIEEKYITKRKNTLVPADPAKRIVLVIDDIHLQRNLKIEVLEFIRAWIICRGYFDIGAGFFKKVSDFGTIMAENINFTATSDKKDRFAFHTSTLYCEEISIENSKPFIQTWFTTTSWSTSTLITKYYILITNALDKLLKQIKRNEGAFSHSSLSKIHKFQYISNFCTNVVVASVNTEKDDVFCTPAGQKSTRREEDALADIFCYEAMRCFGDRIMRAKARSEFINKLTDICQKEFLCDSMYSPAYIDSLLLGNYHVREAKAHVKLTNITHPIRKKHAVRIIQEKIKTYTGNQLLQTLLDMPTGLNDLFRISRIFFKEGMHLAIIGLAGTGKHELVQISAILNDVVILEPNVPSFGEPLQFVKVFKDALKSVAKLNQPTVIQISETQIRDPIYFDYIYTYISSVVRMDECVLFDPPFKAELAEIEATHIRKLKKVTVPDEQTCFKQAVEKIRKMLHIVFLFSDLMTYKETFQLFPQLEYACEVMFLEDMTPQGYQVTAENFLARSNIAPELLGDDQVLSKSLNQVHTDIMDQFKQSFYSAKMKEHSKWEAGPGFGGNIFIFPESQMLTGNVFAGIGGFTVTDSDFRQTLFNMPMELGFMGKHRFGMFLEVFRFLYDLLTMHMSIRKAYYETFLAKSQQFLEFYKEVKAGKQYLHDEQTTKKLIFTQNLKKIEETQRQLSEKKESIGVKEAEIEELREELEIATNEIDEVIKDKEFKLRQYIDKIQQVNKNEFDYFLVTDNFSETEKDLLNILAVVEQVEKRPEDRVEYTKSNFDLLFYHEHKDELCDMLADRRRKEFDEESFKALNKFIKKNPYTAYNNRALTSHLYDYFKELYYKLNIKNTMATTYFRIQEIKMQIDSNIFSVNYAKQSIQVKQEELENLKQQHDIQKIIADKLSRQIEEAQISHMRTEAIEEHIWSYTARIQKKLNNLDSRVDTLLGDSIMLAASVVYLGPFAPEEREATRTKIRLYLEKVRNIDCNYIWKPVKPQRRDIKPSRNIFWHVLRDIGLKEILSLDNLPSVLSPNDLAEALFAILFSPSLPVIADPTGQLEDFIKRTFLQDLPQPNISAADIFSNEKVESAIRYGRMSLVTDLNFMRKMSTGLSQDHSLLKRLSSTLYNGFDFQDFRTACLKKIGTYYSFFSHQTSVNKRVPAFDAKLENISLYQVQVFQPRFDFLLNSEFLQNSSFISAAPSNQTDGILDNNPAIVELKEIFLKNLLVDTSEFKQIKYKLKRINERMWTLESNFENSFLLASGETLKKLADYKQLMEAVMDVNNEKDAKKRHLERYLQIMEQVNLFTEVARVIFQIYMALKFTSKIMNETTYSWRQFTHIVDQITNSAIAKKKISKAGRASSMSLAESQTEMSVERRQLSEMELEIDSEFFSKQVLPVIHRVMMSNVKIDSKNFFNLVFSLRLGLLYNSLTIEEYQFILNQLILLKDFWKWRDPSHQFVNLANIVDKTHIKDMRSLFFKLYPDDATNKAQVGMPLKVFETINQKLGQSFTYQQLSLCIQTVIREKFNMQPVQMITFGFLCPDHEFQAKLTQFMYTQIQTTLDFEEDLLPFKRFIKVANWQHPICMFSAPEVNPINLVTSIAKHYGIPLTILRTDPVITAAKIVENLENAELRDLINSQLLDIANIRFQQKMDLDIARFDNMACNIINEPNGNQVIAKQNWLALKQRNVDLDDNSVTREVNFSQAEEQPVQKILECARKGQWVLICPVQFPQYFTKLSQSLKKMTKEISSNFRLIIDFQGFTQNEIPDSILFNESVTFHIDQSNADAMPSYGDIWNKILEENYLLLLTDPASNKDNLLKIDMLASDFGSSRVSQIVKNMKSIYAKSAENEALTSSFQQYMAEQHKTFEKDLKEQQDRTKSELDEARRLARLAQEERAKNVESKEDMLLEQVQEEDDDMALSNRSELEEYEELKRPTERTETIYKLRSEDYIRNELDSADFTKYDILVPSSGPNELSSEQDEAPPIKAEILSQPEEETKKVELKSKHETIRRQQTMNYAQKIPLTLQDQVAEDDLISLPGSMSKAEDASMYLRVQAPPRSTGGFEVVGQGYSQQSKSSKQQNSRKPISSRKQDK